MYHVTRIALTLLILLQPLAVAAQAPTGRESVLSPPGRGIQPGSDKPNRSKGGERQALVLKGVLGGALVIGGIAMALSGFKKTYREKFVDVDISRPGLDISNWSWTSEQLITWWADAQGTVRNTGNVPLKDVKIFITYYDSSGQFISQEWNFLDVYWLTPLPVNAQDSWSWLSNSTTQPTLASIRAEYAYDPIYERRSAGLEYDGRKSPALGWIGVASVGVGAYLLYDALYQGSKLHAALDKRGVEFELVSNIPAGYGGVKVGYVF